MPQTHAKMNFQQSGYCVGCSMPMQRIDDLMQEAVPNQQLSMFQQQNTKVNDFRNYWLNFLLK
jgi:hypothetical protein